MLNVASRSIDAEVSTKAPLTLPASAAFASPEPILAATSATETAWSKCFWLPSGSVIAGIEDITI
jgi:hypothetical protein